MTKKVTPLMASILLLLTFLTYTSLGLPDSLLGSGWNLIRSDLSVELGTIGLMTFITYIGSTTATYLSPRIINRFQTKWVTLVTVSVIAISLIIMSQVIAFYQLLLFAFPLGFSAATLNVTLNNFLALNYRASHMNYLHSFYGLGVTIAPSIMAFTLTLNSWRLAYIITGIILITIALMITVTFSWWKFEAKTINNKQDSLTFREILKNKKALNSILIFFFYIHSESLFAIWIASYMFIVKGVNLSAAALFPTIFYFALTSGRMISGTLTNRLTSRQLLLFGSLIMVVGAIGLFFNYGNINSYYFTVAILGVGAAPIFPAMMSLNGEVFGTSNLSSYISLQLLLGSMGGGVLTPLFGQIFQRVSIELLPLALFLASLIMLILINRYLTNKKVTNI
jgi:fucose permease